MKEITGKILDKKCFIFDIDGTLIDSMGMWNLVDQKVIKNYLGIDIDPVELKNFRDSVLYDSANIHGDIYKTYYGKLIEYLGLPLTAQEYENERREYSEYLSINSLDYKSGAALLLKKLKDLDKRIAVATTTTKRQYDIYESQNQKLISQASLKKLVDVKVLCEDVQRKKPDPEAYLKVLEKTGFKASDCIVFEDSLNGIISAKDAGIEVVAIYDESARNEQELIEKIADYKIESFNEFMQKTDLDKNQNQPE